MDDTEREERLEAARKRMTRVAVALQRIMPGIDVAGVLIGAAVGVLEENGLDPAVYLRELANELDADPPVVGHA